MEFSQLMADILVYASCKFEMYIFEIVQVIGENVPTAFLYVLSILLFVGEPPMSLLASSVCQVVCESTQIIQLLSRMLDKKRCITFVGTIRWGAASPTNVIHSWLQQGLPTRSDTNPVVK